MSEAKECRRILASGARCHAFAIKDTPYCYFHQAVHDFHQENRSRKTSILIPPPEDRASIQIGIIHVLDALGTSRMDPMRARAYLYGLQLAMQNIGRDRELVCRESVHNPVCCEDGEFLAPEGDEPEPASASAPPCDESVAPAEAPVDQKIPPATVPAADPEPPTESIDISAAAEISAGDSTDGDQKLSRYGNLHEWHLQEIELPEPELRKRKYLEGVVEHLVRGILAASPCKSPRDRHKLREQLRSQYLTRYLAPIPEPRQSTVTTRYMAILLS
jgi:hypothetical protein